MAARIERRHSLGVTEWGPYILYTVEVGEVSFAFDEPGMSPSLVIGHTQRGAGKWFRLWY